MHSIHSPPVGIPDTHLWVSAHLNTQSTCQHTWWHICVCQHIWIHSLSAYLILVSIPNDTHLQVLAHINTHMLVGEMRAIKLTAITFYPSVYLMLHICLCQHMWVYTNSPGVREPEYKHQQVSAHLTIQCTCQHTWTHTVCLSTHLMIHLCRHQHIPIHSLSLCQHIKMHTFLAASTWIYTFIATISQIFQTIWFSFLLS